MGVNQNLIQDAYNAIAFADDMRMLYEQVNSMKSKIERYIVASAAIAAGIADQREITYVQIVQHVITSDDIARIGTFKPLIDAMVSELEGNFDDFIRPI